MDKTIETKHGIYYMRPYIDSDKEKVMQLWEAAFLTKMNEKVWEWKFHNNPFGRQIMLCFTEEGLPIAMYAGIPFSANWNGKNIKMTQLVDNMTHPDYRHATSGRKGLFIQTGEHFFNVYGGSHASVFHYGFPGKIASRLGTLFLKYTKFEEEGAYLNADLKKLKTHRLPVFGSVNTTSVATEDFDQLWEDAKQYYPFVVKRNKDFIQWRFFEHPNHKYAIYIYKNMWGKVLAYAAVLVKDNMATIVDMFGLPHKKAIRAIVQKIKTELLSSGISTIQIWVSKKHFITEYLIQLGLEVKDEPLGIFPTGRSLDEKLDIDFAVKNIYYTMGDGDLF